MLALSPTQLFNGDRIVEDVTVRSGVGALTRPWTGWGNAIVDLNNDGYKDLFAACAGVLDPRGATGDRVPMPNLLLLNKGGRFVDGNATAGKAFERKAVHHGGLITEAQYGEALMKGES